MDGKDIGALHCRVLENDHLVAYARILQQDSKLAIGRVVVKRTHRKLGIGKSLMCYAIDQCKVHFGPSTVELSAQCYIQAFYESLGFIAKGESYLEDGIPHIHMIRDSTDL